MKSLPFYIPEAWKRYPFRAEPPRIGHYREYPPPPPGTWYRINYAGTQITQWDFQHKGKSGWTGKSSFVLEVPLRYLRPSVIFSVLCDRILQRAYLRQQNTNQTETMIVLLHPQVFTNTPTINTCSIALELVCLTELWLNQFFRALQFQN